MIYYLGSNRSYKQDAFKYGYDNDDGQYIVLLRDHIAYRYEIVEVIGSGAFSQV